MNLSLSSIATALSAVSSAAQASETIYKFGASLIDAAETAYQSVNGAGSTKKAAVMAALEAVCAAVGQSWDTIKAEISAWIDLVIAAWRSATALFAGATDQTGAPVLA